MDLYTFFMSILVGVIANYIYDRLGRRKQSDSEHHDLHNKVTKKRSPDNHFEESVSFTSFVGH